MSETKTEYVVEYRRSKELNWQESNRWPSKEKAEAQFRYEAIRFPQMQHRLIRLTVLKESK